jgi:hypothetical protein
MVFIISGRDRYLAALTCWSGSHDGEIRKGICHSGFGCHGDPCLRPKARGVLTRALARNLPAVRISWG